MTPQHLYSYAHYYIELTASTTDVPNADVIAAVTSASSNATTSAAVECSAESAEGARVAGASAGGVIVEKGLAANR